MAASVVNVTLWYVSGPLPTGQSLQIVGDLVADENIATPTSSTQATAAPASLADHAAWRIVPKGGDVYLNFGSNPTAAAGNTLVTAGSEFWKWAKPGEVVAAIDA